METQLEEMKFATISMNCGNDRSGIEDKIFEILSGTAPPDILTIHAQEVNYGAELTRLATRLEGSAYRVMACQPRITATKLSAALTRKTGLCNFVIYNADKFDEPQENDPKIIVSPSVISNKGALISRISLKPKTQEHPIYMALVAGHLDSFEEQSRLLEWQLIYNTIHPSAANWEGLVAITPDIIVGGFDANTRYETGKPVNPWQMATATEETKAYLSTLPLGRVLSSEEATYNKPLLQSIGEASSHPSSPRSVAEMSTIEGKRPGLADMGNLDITIWQSGQGETAPSISCQIIPFDGMTERDHSAVLSNFNFSPYTSEFERVKAHVLFQLQLHDQAKKPENAQYQQLLNELANPELSEEDAKLLLVTYYNTFIVNEPNQAFTEVFGIRPRATSSAFSIHSNDGDSPSSSPTRSRSSSFSSLFSLFRGESNSPQPGADNPALNALLRQDSEEEEPDSTTNPMHAQRKKGPP